MFLKGGSRKLTNQTRTLDVGLDRQSLKMLTQLRHLNAILFSCITITHRDRLILQ